jgi:hypothetical protein
MEKKRVKMVKDNELERIQIEYHKRVAEHKEKIKEAIKEPNDSMIYKIGKVKFDELKSQMETEWEGHRTHQSTVSERGIEVRTILMMLDWIKDSSK